MSQLFHLVNPSPWPILVSICSFSGFSSLLLWISTGSMIQMFFVTFGTTLMVWFWWRDVVRESLYEGEHTKPVQFSLKISMLLFIFSEVMFFSGFFWSFLHMSLSPSMELGMVWPPISLNPLNPFRIPFLNTLVLVSSGVTVTWCHHLLLESKSGLVSLSLTVLLGVYFSYLQWKEYKEASFSISESVYGSVFFMSTGFHGFHVLIGSSFLLVCLLRLSEKEFSSGHFIGVEMAIWYWHFVDVVWLFLFSLIYWWGF